MKKKLLDHIYADSKLILHLTEITTVMAKSVEADDVIVF